MKNKLPYLTLYLEEDNACRLSVCTSKGTCIIENYYETEVPALEAVAYWAGVIRGMEEEHPEELHVLLEDIEEDSIELFDDLETKTKH